MPTSGTIQTDYLVVGAGLSGLCFADEMISRSNFSITMVDERDAAGGHWNDAYSFVKLHQPSAFYGVESLRLGDDGIEADGPNAGLMTLAEGPEILAYCHAVMRDRLLKSGQVAFIPYTRHLGQGVLQHRLTKQRIEVSAARKIVDATYYTNSIPLNHTKNFTVDPHVLCLPPNDLPRRAPEFEKYTIIGGGKTGADACLWLMMQGVEPDDIRWIIPRDQWFINRARVQTDPKFFETVFSGFADARRDVALATSARDLVLRHEKSGIWLRLDANIEPMMFHGAHMSEGELVQLRRVRDIVRLGYVHNITAESIELTNGSIPAKQQTLYVDCTASALPARPPEPVFQGKDIVLQAVRYPQIPFSAALIGFLETQQLTDEQKNAFCAPVPVTKTIEDYVRALIPDLANRLAVARDPAVRDWVRHSRLDGFSGLAAAIDVHTQPTEAALLERLRQETKAAVVNLPALLASL